MSIDVEKIRNIAVIAHGGAGKTSLVEAMLFDSGISDRLGNIQDGSTIMDYEPEEINRQISISSAAAYCEWKGHRLNIIDTPGYINFIEDTKCCLSAVDGAIVIVSALSGVKAETGKIWQFACKYEIPRMVFINKLDRENSSFEMALAEIEESYGATPVPLNIPIGAEADFKGVIDIIKMKAIIYKNGKSEETEIPEDMKDTAADYREKLMENVAEIDDDLLEKYIETGSLTDEELINGIREGSLTRRFIPCVCGSATGNIGVQQLLDNVLLCLPSPLQKVNITPISGKDLQTGKLVQRQPSAEEPLSVRVFKTIADPFAGKLTLFRVFSGKLKSDSLILNASNDTKEKIGHLFYMYGKKHEPVTEVGPGEIAAVAKFKSAQTGDTLCDASNPILFEPIQFSDPMISYAIVGKTRGDEDKVSTGLHRLLEEDPTLKLHLEAETQEMILAGMGQVHLEITLEKLKRKFGADVIMKAPKIPYRETIKESSSARGKYKKQSGGKGQFGDCWINIEPLERAAGFEFVDKIVGGVVPRQYIPAVEKGIIETMHEGLLAGYPVVDIKATLYDGSYHSVDSSEMAFKIAGSMALKNAALEAKMVLLEPLVHVEVITPDEFLGQVIGDLNSKRGKVQGVEPQAGGNQKISALVPMAEMLIYANQLNSLTSARGIYTMEASHYEEVPSHIAQKIIAERNSEA
ncbi:MAG: elongation factor G [Nitrospira sp.]|nr:elongation factor G [bacterium]MBL7049884.1 elongation factor G [Nitrospira sp.]